MNVRAADRQVIDNAKAGIVSVIVLVLWSITAPSAAQGTAVPPGQSPETAVGPTHLTPNTSAISGTPTSGHVATMDASDLQEFSADPANVRQLISEALALTRQNLGYAYGSSDPATGGMDCSGTVYFLLRQAGVKNVPRDASEMYRWAWTQGDFRAVVSSNPKTFELDSLKPGDLLFWTGTYKVERDPPVTHVMIYLGRSRSSGQRVMVGASEGRRYQGQSRYGVSVFDFTLPRQRTSPGTHESQSSEPESRFIGYSPVPGLSTVNGAPNPSP